MPYEQIITERRGRVGVIRLNRPEKLNAYTTQMSAEMCDQLAKWNADPAVGAVVLTGEGRSFCAGADIGGFGQRLERIRGGSERTDAPFVNTWVDLVRRSKPVVVAFNGYAIGIGLTMALPCDLRIAAEGALLSIRFVKLGLVPELGSTRLLAQLVGLGMAADMCLSGRFVQAEEALRCGLVSAVVPGDRLMETALERAREIAENPTGVVMMIKELLRENPLDPDLDRVMEREQVRDRIARTLPAHAEAIDAFREKREPRFN